MNKIERLLFLWTSLASGLQLPVFSRLKQEVSDKVTQRPHSLTYTAVLVFVHVVILDLHTCKNVILSP